MNESKEVKQIRRLRDDAEERGMEPALLLCYQEWILHTMLAEINEVTNDIMRRRLEK